MRTALLLAGTLLIAATLPAAAHDGWGRGPLVVFAPQYYAPPPPPRVVYVDPYRPYYAPPPVLVVGPRYRHHRHYSRRYEPVRYPYGWR